MMRRPHPEDRDDDNPPAEGIYLFRWFQEIARGRPISAMGHYLPIPSTEIAAWATLAQVTLLGWELDTLRKIDSAFLTVMNAKD